MKQFFLILFILADVLVLGQTESQSFFGAGVEFGRIKNTFANSKSVYSYVKYKAYAKPSLLIRNPLNALSSGISIGVGCCLTNRRSLGLSYSTLPYTRYQMSQVMIESGIDLLPYFSDHSKLGLVTSFACGTACVKGVRGVKLSTQPSVSLHYRANDNIKLTVGGEVSLIHHTNTKFLTYLAGSVGASYVFKTQRAGGKRVRVIQSGNYILPSVNVLVKTLSSRDVLTLRTDSIVDHLNVRLEQISKEAPLSFTFTDYEKNHVHVYSHVASGKRNKGVIEVKRSFRNPLPGARLISPYKGKRPNHHGIDLKLSQKDTIRAAFDGQVRLAKRYSTYGNVVVIRHIDGLETLYSHNTTNLVRSGDLVKSGDPIAISGRTGRATTDHLHFEVRVNGMHVNPCLFYDFRNDRMVADSILIAQSPQGSYTVRSLSSDQSGLLEEEVKTQKRFRISRERAFKLSDARPKRTGAVHVIKKGDTLEGIAQKYNTTIRELCRVNQLASITLKIGSKIFLP